MLIRLTGARGPRWDGFSGAEVMNLLLLTLALVGRFGSGALSTWESPPLQKDYLLLGEVEMPSGDRLQKPALVVLHGVRTPFYRQTVSEPGGNFRFKGIPAGTYTLTAEAPGRGYRTVTVEISSSFADSKRRIRRTLVLQAQSAPNEHEVSVRELMTPKPALRLYQRAQKHLGGGNVKGAVEALTKAVDKWPQFTQAWNLLGTIANKAQRFEEAKTHFERALEASPRSFAPLVNLGGVLISLKRFSEALKINLQAVADKPNDALANSQLGLSYLGTGEEQLAITHLVRAKQADPSHFSHPQLSLARIYLRQGRVGEARQELREFVRLHPDRPESDMARRAITQLSQRQD